MMAVIVSLRGKLTYVARGVVPFLVLSLVLGAAACGDREAEEVPNDTAADRPAGAEATPDGEPVDLVGDLMEIELSIEVVRRLPAVYAALETALDSDPAIMERMQQHPPPTSLEAVAAMYEGEPAIRELLRSAGVSAYDFATNAHFPSVYGTVIMVEAGLPVMMEPREHHVAFVRENREELETILERLVEIGAIPEVPQVPEGMP